jgi:hypothetical protein
MNGNLTQAQHNSHASEDKEKFFRELAGSLIPKHLSLLARKSLHLPKIFRQHLVAPALILLVLSNLSICAAAEPDSERNGFIIIPFPIYTPETKAAATLSGIYHHRDAEDLQVPPSTVIFSMTYSELKQTRVGLTPELYLGGGHWLLHSSFAYEDWPNKFWGIGNDSKEGFEEDYSSRNKLALVDLQRRLGSAWWLGLRYDYADYKLTEVEPGGLLNSGLVLGSNGGPVVGIGIIATRDTRDDIYYPHTGSFVKMGMTRFDKGLGSNYNYNRYELDARGFISLGGQQVLALQGYSKITDGEVPFQSLARIGVESDVKMMRGYHDGRFLDKVSVLTQAEYRFPIAGRWSAAAFAGLGEVAPAVDELAVSALKWKPLGLACASARRNKKPLM